MSDPALKLVGSASRPRVSFPHLVGAKGSERERVSGLGVDQQNLTVQNQVVAMRKRFWDVVFEVIDLQSKRNPKVKVNTKTPTSADTRICFAEKDSCQIKVKMPPTAHHRRSQTFPRTNFP